MKLLFLSIFIYLSVNGYGQIDKIKIKKNDTTFVFENDTCNCKIIIDKSVYGKNLEFVYLNAIGVNTSKANKDISTFTSIYVQKKKIKLTQSNIQSVFRPICKLLKDKLSSIKITNHIININTANRKGFDAYLEYIKEK